VCVVISIRTVSMLFKGDEWNYVDEGNANIILEYVGGHPGFIHTVMRVEKQPPRSLSYEKWKYKKYTMRSLFEDRYIQLPVSKIMDKMYSHLETYCNI
jgi:hypothetical protein